MKSGNSLSATFMRKVPEPVFMPVNSVRVFGVTALSGTRSRNNSFGPTLAATARAKISSPLVSTTPVTAPSAVMISRTLALVRMCTPRRAADDAMARVMAPMPPMACPQAPRLPFTSPKQWCSSTYAVPGVDGAA